MTEQEDLFNRKTRLETAAWRYMDNNPTVWKLFKKFAFEAAKHMKTYSGQGIVERIRWFTNVPTVGERNNPDTNTPLKISNDHVAYFTRRFVDEYPYMKPFFRFRDVKDD